MADTHKIKTKWWEKTYQVSQWLNCVCTNSDDNDLNWTWIGLSLLHQKILIIDLKKRHLFSMKSNVRMMNVEKEVPLI